MRVSPRTVKLPWLISLLVLVASGGQVNAQTGALAAWLATQSGTQWSGESELWLDPAGNEGQVSPATLRVEPTGLSYTWVYKDRKHRGELGWGDGTATWKDSWHQPEVVSLLPVRGHGSLIAAEYSYPASSGPDWHWRIKLAERPDGALVLQMTNIAPWGEETRAVRVVVYREY